MENTITKEQVEHIAKLCNLKLSGAEIEKLSTMLTQTLDTINILDELDTSAVSETYQVTGLTNIFQKEDVEVTTLTQDEALSNAHEKIANKFATKAIFDR